MVAVVIICGGILVAMTARGAPIVARLFPALGVTSGLLWLCTTRRGR